MWTLVASLFLVWVLLRLIQSMLRTAVLWKWDKTRQRSSLLGGPSGPIAPGAPRMGGIPRATPSGVLPEGASEASYSGETASLGNPPGAWEGPSTATSSWFLRLRYGAKVARDNTLVLLTIALLSHLRYVAVVKRPWLGGHGDEVVEPAPVHPPIHPPPFDGDAVDALFAGSSVLADQPLKDYYGRPLQAVYVLTWITFDLVALQLLVHLVVEPLWAAFRRRSTGYHYIGPGIYG